MSLTSTEFNLLSDIASGIREGGRASGNTVPLSVYNELLARYTEEVGLTRSLKDELDQWKTYGNGLEADLGEWKGYARRQKARAERAEAELARLRGQAAPKAA